jgi:LytS/YehU family sensor histidine kinase
MSVYFRPHIFLHIIGCLVFLSLPVIFTPHENAPIGLFHSIIFRQDFIGYLLMIAFFYLNYYVLIPAFYFDKKYVTFAILVLICYMIIILTPKLIIKDENLYASIKASFPILKTYLFKIFSQHIFEFLVILTFSLMLKINNRLKLAEKEKVNAELSYLKAQINPHFLFNTLNSIYSLAIAQSDYTATAVVKLSSMMRYVITDASQKFVPLEKEINYISDYIELQKLRIDKGIKLSFEVSGIASDKKIAPLILISFIENAFKYGINAEENSEIKINIDITKNYLHLRVYNKKVNTKQMNIQTSGVGIENTANRLQLLYSGRHKLTVKNNSEDFSILLSLQLT